MYVHRGPPDALGPSVGACIGTTSVDFRKISFSNACKSHSHGEIDRQEWAISKTQITSFSPFRKDRYLWWSALPT